MGNLITTQVTEKPNNTFIDAKKRKKAEEEERQDKQREKEIRLAERRYDRQQVAEAKKREKA